MVFVCWSAWECRCRITACSLIDGLAQACLLPWLKWMLVACLVHPLLLPPLPRPSIPALSATSGLVAVPTQNPHGVLFSLPGCNSSSTPHTTTHHTTPHPQRRHPRRRRHHASRITHALMYVHGTPPSREPHYGPVGTGDLSSATDRVY